MIQANSHVSEILVQRGSRDAACSRGHCAFQLMRLLSCIVVVSNIFTMNIYYFHNHKNVVDTFRDTYVWTT